MARPLLKGVGVPTPITILGAALLAWWTADRTDLVTESSGLVSSWRDVVAGYDATAATTARPTWAADSFGGAPGLSFDGTANCLTLGSVPFPAGADPSEIWGLCQQDALAADTGGRILVGYGDAAATSRRLQRVVSGGLNRLNIVTGNGTTAPNQTETTVDVSSRHVVRGEFGATESFISIDGGARATAVAAIPATATSRFRIGAANAAGISNFWSGRIRDIIVTAPLSSEQSAQLWIWLLARRGV